MDQLILSQIGNVICSSFKSNATTLLQGQSLAHYFLHYFVKNSRQTLSIGPLLKLCRHSNKHRQIIKLPMILFKIDSRIT